MLAATTAAALPSFHPSSSSPSAESRQPLLHRPNSPSSPSSSSSSLSSSSSSSSSSLSHSSLTTNYHTFSTSPPTPLSTPPPSPIPSKPSPLAHRSHPSANPLASYGPTQRLLLRLWDSLWQLHIRILATSGAAAMQTWECIFMLLFSTALIALLAIAAAKLPAFTSHAIARMSFYATGTLPPPSSMRVIPAAASGQPMQWLDWGRQKDFNYCQKVIASAVAANLTTHQL